MQKLKKETEIILAFVQSDIFKNWISSTLQSPKSIKQLTTILEATDDDLWNTDIPLNIEERIIKDYITIATTKSTYWDEFTAQQIIDILQCEKTLSPILIGRGLNKLKGIRKKRISGKTKYLIESIKSFNEKIAEPVKEFNSESAGVYPAKLPFKKAFLLTFNEINNYCDFPIKENQLFALGAINVGDAYYIEKIVRADGLHVYLPEDKLAKYKK